MPHRQVPVYKSNENESENKVESDAGNLAKDFGGGDYGAEEARADAGKGNKGETGSEPGSNPPD
ncbi:hypothetical protein [Pedobacter yulinensis]|nr:hypothetical protein [Pedobacter yulinensis]